MPDLRALDLLEIRGHTFDCLHVEPFFNFWKVSLGVDGRLCQWYEPRQNTEEAGLRWGTPEFESYLKAQSLSNIAREVRHG